LYRACLLKVVSLPNDGRVKTDDCKFASNQRPKIIEKSQQVGDRKIDHLAGV